MKRLVFCIVAALAIGFSNQQANAQYQEGQYIMKFNGERVIPNGDLCWGMNLPSKDYYVDVTVKAYKVTNGQLVEIPWDINPTYAPELNKTKVGNNTLRISFDHNYGSHRGCPVALTSEAGGCQFWVNFPPDSY